MPQVCLACTHPKRSEIDEAILQGQPNSRIGIESGLGEHVIRRHKRVHLLPTLVGARTAREKLNARAPVKAVLVEVERPHDLLEMVDDLYSRARGLLDKAEGAGKYGPAASAIRESTRLCELLARLTGELQSGTTINAQVNVTASPEWITLRRVVLEAVWPFPQARAALGEALASLEESNTNFDPPPKTAGQGPASLRHLPEQEPE